MAASAAARRLPQEDPEPQPGGGMSFLDHLDELRSRIIRCCIAIAVGAVAAFFFINRIVDFVLTPARAALPQGTTLIYTRGAAPLALYINIGLMTGAVLASPFVMYQVWRFIAPALYATEKKFVIPFVLLTSTGAIGGAAFSHYVLFPAMIAFFGTFNSNDLRFMPNVDDVFDLYLRMLLGMVLVFQIPTLVFFLAKMGLVTARWLWRNIKYAILVIFVVAAVLTPSPDPWNQTVFAAPMIALYFVSIAIAWAVAPRQPAR
jgi:sec-independent protein translocase protein TatC